MLRLRQTIQVVRPTGFWPRSRQAFAAKWLYAHHRTDNIAIHVNIADMSGFGNQVDGFINPTMHPHCQSIARGIDIAHNFR